MVMQLQAPQLQANPQLVSMTASAVYWFDHWLAKATCGLVQWTSICRSWTKAYRKISQAWRITCFNQSHMPQSGEMIRENMSQMNIINFDQDKFIYI